MNLPKWIAEAMISHAIEGLPNECCGILAGKNTEVSNLFRMKNVEESPFRYSMDGKEMLLTEEKLTTEGVEQTVAFGVGVRVKIINMRS